jgi:exonuclease VII large subunit
LFVDQRPRVALLFATSSITMSDFEAGINAAKSAIDFVEYRANFSNANELVGTLQSLDKGGFHVIALVRGGGARIESLDDVSVLEQIVSMKTPTIGAIGHVEEKTFIKQLVDKCASTPNGLGQYFSEMVESVSEKKTKSRAALTEQIKKQFKDQLETSQKQNKELQEKLKVLTKAQEDSVKAQQEATKKHNEQVQAAQKQNKELQEQLKGIQKSHQDQITKLTEAQKLQQEQQKKQQEELNKNLGKMQESNNQLQKNLAAITTQNTESLKQLAQAKERAKDLEHKLSEAQNGKGNNLWILIAIIAIILLIVSFMLK